MTPVLLLLSLFVLGDAHSFKHSTELTPKELAKWLKSPKPILVMFYAPWCGHCQKLIPDWDAAAKALSPAVRVGALNADQYKEMGQQYGIQGFPTIKMWYPHAGGPKRAPPVDYNGAREKAALVTQGESLVASTSKAVTSVSALGELKNRKGAKEALKKAAVLFTSKTTVPIVWKGLSATPPLSGLSFGHVSSSNAKKILTELGVEDKASSLPQLCVLDLTTPKPSVVAWYDGQYSYDPTAEWLKSQL